MNRKYRLATVDSPPPPAAGYWVVPNLFLAGPYPGHYDLPEHKKKIRTMVDAGIRTFVNLMHEDEIDHECRTFRTYDKLIMEYSPTTTFVRFPIVDLSVPSAEEMTLILDAIDQSLEGKRPVYVHCWGGVGRTGTVVGCWLLRHGFATPKNYLDVLSGLRRQDRLRGQRMSPETGEQQRFVREWFAANLRK